jgi:transposase
LRGNVIRDENNKQESVSLEVVHPNAAGIDVGNASHYVAVPADRDAEPVREFECFTQDLNRLADWLGQCRIQTVAMQSTGVYFALSSALFGRVEVPLALG